MFNGLYNLQGAMPTLRSSIVISISDKLKPESTKITIPLTRADSHVKPTSSKEVITSAMTTMMTEQPNPESTTSKQTDVVR